MAVPKGADCHQCKVCRSTKGDGPRCYYFRERVVMVFHWATASPSFYHDIEFQGWSLQRLAHYTHTLRARNGRRGKFHCSPSPLRQSIIAPIRPPTSFLPPPFPPRPDPISPMSWLVSRSRSRLSPNWQCTHASTHARFISRKGDTAKQSISIFGAVVTIRLFATHPCFS